jgi:hypothetical protein
MIDLNDWHHALHSVTGSMAVKTRRRNGALAARHTGNMPRRFNDPPSLRTPCSPLKMTLRTSCLRPCARPAYRLLTGCVRAPFHPSAPRRVRRLGACPRARGCVFENEPIHPAHHRTVRAQPRLN